MQTLVKKGAMDHDHAPKEKDGQKLAAHPDKVKEQKKHEAASGFESENVDPNASHPTKGK